MNCFEVLKEVLDEAYDAIQGNEAEKDKKIRTEMERLSRLYADLTVHRDIDYGEPTTRFAYVYMYVSCHANLVDQLIRKHEELRNVFETGRVHLSCIGGGPGSDLLGVLKFLESSSSQIELTARIFDRAPAWSETYADLFAKVDCGARVLPSFTPFDVTREEEWRVYRRYLSSDLFTMIYFMSELFGVRDQAEPYFAHLFANARSGALFLFVDNQRAGATTAFSDWFDSLASAGGIQILHSGDGRMVTPPDEEKRDLGRYYDKFRDPKIQAFVAWRVGRKT